MPSFWLCQELGGFGLPDPALILLVLVLSHAAKIRVSRVSNWVIRNIHGSGWVAKIQPELDLDRVGLVLLSDPTRCFDKAVYHIVLDRMVGTHRPVAPILRVLTRRPNAIPLCLHHIVQTS
jgi:hypothetical protein